MSRMTPLKALNIATAILKLVNPLTRHQSRGRLGLIYPAPPSIFTRPLSPGCAVWVIIAIIVLPLWLLTKV
jgi:hypothetical protein